MDPHLYPDDYQRLRYLAERHAMQLRQEAIREAHAWVARRLQRMGRRFLQALKTPSTLSQPPTPETPKPCQPSL